MSKFKHVQRGDPLEIGAASFNTMMDVARAYDRGELGPRQPRGQQQYRETWVQNSTGAAVGQFAVLGINGAPLDPSSGRVETFSDTLVFDGVTPEADLHEAQFVVTLEPIRDGAVGRAVVAGEVQCKINVSDSGHEWAEIEDASSTRLESRSTGSARILWKQSGTGEVWAIVRLGNPATPVSNWRMRRWYESGSYSFTVPAGFTQAEVWMVGGGGGGAAGQGRGSVSIGGSTAWFGGAGGGGGGGGGGIVARFAVIPGDQFDVTIGAGGTGEVYGGAGATDGSDTTLTSDAGNTGPAVNLTAEGGSSGGLFGGTGPIGGNGGVGTGDIGTTDFDSDRGVHATEPDHGGFMIAGGKGHHGAPGSGIDKGSYGLGGASIMGLDGFGGLASGTSTTFPFGCGGAGGYGEAPTGGGADNGGDGNCGAMYVFFS